MGLISAKVPRTKFFLFCAIDTHTGDCRPFDKIQLNDIACTNGVCVYRTDEEAGSAPACGK